MRGRIGLLFRVGFVGLLAAANAQTSSSASRSTQFGGIYAFVSSAKGERNLDELGQSYGPMSGSPDSATTDHRQGPGAA